MAKDSTVTAETLCTRCDKNSRAAGHDWCRQCKAEKQAEYSADRDAMMEARGFAKGAEAMRDALLIIVNNAHPNGVLRMIDVGRFIIETKAPVFLRRAALDAVGDG